MKRLFLIPGFKTAASLLICLCLLVQLTSCGTMLYPERRGVPHDPAQIDVKVVIMDGVLLLFFIVPGVIAYAVDFSTGCIYLPPGQITQNPDDRAPSAMQVIRVAPERLDLETLPDLVEQHTGLPIAPNSARMRIFRPDSGAIHVHQELVRLSNGQVPLSQGLWYSGEQVRLLADADGRILNVALIASMGACLTTE